ncbi:MAG: hypothetical protein II333_09645 [Clostridia bacterium]|nr:hypothetical protein [Clostridia bacterium]
MPLTITNYPHGGVLLSEPAPFALDAKTRADILEKWDAANYDGEVDDLLDEAEKIASPRAFLRRAYVTDADEAGVVLTTEDNGEEKTYRIDSPLVAEKLRRDTTVVGTVATCGRALYDLSVSYADDPLLREVAEDICLAYMRHISIALHEYLREHIYGGDKFSRLSPGSLSSWDIAGQVPLFDFLGEGTALAEVELTPSYLMIPYKSGSGLSFPTDSPFESCMRCPRENCPNRRAEYQEA